MGPPWDVGMKLCSHVPGHMTKMASRPIYGKSLQKYPSSEPRGRWPWNLVYSIWWHWVCLNNILFTINSHIYSTIIFDTGSYKKLWTYINHLLKTQGWPWRFLWRCQICFLMLLHGWNAIQHIVMYCQAYSNWAQVRDTRPLVLLFE